MKRIITIKFLHLAILVLGLSLAFTGCEKSPASPVIAQVGTRVLTLDDVYQNIPPEYRSRITREQYVNFVKQWIDDEVLYQEALRRGVDREKTMRDRLAKMKRDLLCGELISRSAGSGESLAVSEAVIKNYYEQHKAEFIRTQPMVKYLQIVVDNEQLAWVLCGKAIGPNFYTLAAKYSAVPLPDSASIPYVSVANLPPEVGQTLLGTRIGGTPAPVRSNLGFHILRLLDKQDKGTQSSLEEARPEIVDRLSTQMQKQELSKLLSGFRMKTQVSFFPNRIPGATGADTVKQ
jgi:hypothetical protein